MAAERYLESNDSPRRGGRLALHRMKPDNGRDHLFAQGDAEQGRVIFFCSCCEPAGGLSMDPISILD